jgi:hypothetical protein
MPSRHILNNEENNRRRRGVWKAAPDPLVRAPVVFDSLTPGTLQRFAVLAEACHTRSI